MMTIAREERLDPSQPSVLFGLGKAVAGALIGYAAGATLLQAAHALWGWPVSDEAVMIVGYVLATLGFLTGLGAFSYALEWATGREPEDSTPHAADRGWRRYFLFTTDHKVVGIQYLVTSFVLFLVGGLLAMVMRAHLMAPAGGLLSGQWYNNVMSLHGTIMVAVALVAIIGGLGNFLVPLMIGARDVAFPRLNALSFWLLPPAVVVLLSCVPLGGFGTGWTAYPPLSLRVPLGQQSYILALITIGLSSILGSINFITTILRLRAPGLTMGRLPIFVWSLLASSAITLYSTPVLAGALVLLMLDRVLGASFFKPDGGGQVLLYEHLFWFYSHPAVYIMILPAFGAILEILPVHARKPLFAYRLVVASFITIVGLSGMVWAHHMFTSGMAAYLHGPFMLLTELISVPTGVVFLAALSTIWLGRLRLVTPMLFAIGFVATFIIGGITGIFLADVLTDLHLHDTYFVVAHFHYTILGGMIFALFAGLYHWFPKITGRMLNDRLGKAHFTLTFLLFHATFTPMFWLGMNGMPRRVAAYAPPFAELNVLVSILAFGLGAAQLLFVANAVWSWARGPRAVANPWAARTLEWSVASPPPVENFEAAPEVVGSPYDYGVPGARHAVLAGSAAH